MDTCICEIGGQKKRETIQHGLEVARDSGVLAVFDMPNTDPPIFTRDHVAARLQLAREANVPEVFYGLYMGLTADKEQVRRAVDVHKEFFPHVVGFKLYAGHSVGNLGVTCTTDQYGIYETLAQEGYTGVLAVHAEKEECMEHSIWTPNNPISHCHARPEEAEIASVEDQIYFAQSSGFVGKLEIPHISSPKAVALVTEAREKGLDIHCAVCPHHFIYDWGKMGDVKFKMNPPLRSPESAAQMFELLRKGEIGRIETDHAPHILAQKVGEPYMSGLPGLPWWPIFEEHLRMNEFSDKQIEDLLFNNTLERFEIDITRRSLPRKYRGDDYTFNPYAEMMDLLK